MRCDDLWKCSNQAIVVRHALVQIRSPEEINGRRQSHHMIDSTFRSLAQRRGFRGAPMQNSDESARDRFLQGFASTPSGHLKITSKQTTVTPDLNAVSDVKVGSLSKFSCGYVGETLRCEPRR